MSEEIAMTDANLAHIERLREQLAYEQLRAEDLTRELAAARSVVDAARSLTTENAIGDVVALRRALAAYDVVRFG